MRQEEHFSSKILLKYFMLMLICLIIPLVILSIWYTDRSRDVLYEEIIRRNESALIQTKKNMDAILLSSKNMAYSLSVDQSVEYLAYRNTVSDDPTDGLSAVVNMLSNLKKFGSYIDSIYLYFDRSQEIVTDSAVVPKDVFKDSAVLDYFSPDMERTIVLKTREKNGKYPYLLSAVCPIRQNTGAALGIVVVNLDIELLGDYLGSGRYRNTEASPSFFILDDSEGKLIYSDEYRLLRDSEDLTELKNAIGVDLDLHSGMITLWDMNYLFSGLRAPDEKMLFVYLTSTGEFDSKSNALEGNLFVVILLVMAVGFFVAYVLARIVYRPIRSTMKTLSDLSMLTDWHNGDYKNEIDVIQQSIRTAKQEKDTMAGQIQERAAMLHKARLSALQTQINPHFMYNTLASIGNYAALLLGKDNVITEMEYVLAKLLRISLSGDNYLVPLSDELEHVKLYLQLVDFRYNGRVRLHMDIPESLSQVRIAKLTLQPLIENTIQHGFAAKRNYGDIWLQGEKNGNEIFLYVSDNGVGAQPEAMDKLEVNLTKSALNRNSNIGLGNVDQRLKLIFGDAYGLRIESPPEGGFRVIIHFRDI